MQSLSRDGKGASAVARDRRGVPVDVAAIQRAIDLVVESWHPEQIWLFGSRARGDATAESDWDLFVVIPDDLDESAISPLAAWQLRKASGARAELFPCRAEDFREARDTPNTIAYDVRNEGVLLFER